MSETARKPIPPRHIRATRRWTWLAALTGILAINAFGGAVGLMTGVIDFGIVLSSRFPFHSPVLAGLALVLVVGAPMSWVTHLAVRRDSKTGAAAVVAGSWLIGWVVIEFGVLRATSWLQPVLAFAGLLVLLVGLHEPDRQRSPVWNDS
jgi:hypothetical protein